MDSKPIPVLYEDDRYIVFDKPPRLLVIPTPRKEKNTLIDIVNRQVASSDKDWKLHPCHRLDKETSGLIIFAKGKRNQRLMLEIFKNKSIKKTYIAFVHGSLPKKEGQFCSAIKDLDQKKFQRNAPSRQSTTRYKILEKKKHFSIAEVQPITGRTNQIRIHFSEDHHPLVGDRKYAFARDYPLKFRRTALHACALEWRDPQNGRTIKVKSELPKDMEEFIARNTNQRKNIK